MIFKLANGSTTTDKIEWANSMAALGNSVALALGPYYYYGGCNNGSVCIDHEKYSRSYTFDLELARHIVAMHDAYLEHNNPLAASDFNALPSERRIAISKETTSLHKD